MHHIEELGAVEFPMLKAFHTLNLSTSNAAQSAPSSVARYPLEKWAQIDMALRTLTAYEFVTLAIPDGSPLSEELEQRPEFKEWMLTWV